MSQVFDYISYNDLIPLFQWGAQTLLSEEYILTMTPLQQIKSLCYAFQSALKNPNADQQQVYLLGAQIVFQLRSYLLQEEIYFSIGATSPDGQQLSSKMMAQDEIFKYLQANLRSRSIELNSAIESFDSNNVSDLSYLWSKVVNAATFDWDEGYSEKKMYTTSRRAKRYVYRKPNPDLNVWVRYYTRQKKRYLTHYYDKGNFDLVAYNHGWLYEWFQEYMQDRQNALALQAAFATSATPLEDLMSGVSRENIAGFKGGDYIDALGRQVQAKLGNKRIISFKSIETVINNILSIIQFYETNVKSASNAQQMAQKFANLFTDTRTLNQSYDTIVDSILSQLNFK